MLDALEFYSNRNGHKPEHLYIVRTIKKPKLYLAGDSSFDNKKWVNRNWFEATNGYEDLLTPPSMVGDICYFLNLYSEGKYFTINCASEDATVNDKTIKLNDSDAFIRDNIQSDDILVVSIGGNDIASKPSGDIMLNFAKVLLFTSISEIQSQPHKYLDSLIDLFLTKVKRYILKLIQNQKPKKIIICGIYYPCEMEQKSCFDTTLNLIGYNSNPGKIKVIIENIFKHAIQKINIEGVETIHIPMHNVLNSKDDKDYVERVEPSVQGGEKIAKKILEFI